MSLFTFRVRVLRVILIRAKTNIQKKRKGGTDEIHKLRARVTVTLEKLRLIP